MKLANPLLIVVLVLMLLMGITVNVKAQANPHVPIFIFTNNPPDNYKPVMSSAEILILFVDGANKGKQVWTQAWVSGYYLANDNSRPPEYEISAYIEGHQYPARFQMTVESVGTSLRFTS